MTSADYNTRCKLEISQVNYHGWPDSYSVTNGFVEAIVVPAIGRVMQFRLAGEPSGAFWENRSLEGLLATQRPEWDNFGGDKAWPAPQKDWALMTGRPWPPPETFDAAPAQATVRDFELILTSRVDPQYGVQVVRLISMRAGLPVMDIRTTFLKLAGSPINVGVWIVTQLREPKRAFALLPDPQAGYVQVVGPTPMDLRTDGRLLSLRRDRNHNTKIATAGNSLAWMDDDYVLRIDGYVSSENDCVASVYTNMDPLSYVELETEGTVTSIVAGERLELTNTYTLAFRSEEGEIAEAEKTFGLATRAEAV